MQVSKVVMSSCLRLLLKEEGRVMLGLVGDPISVLASRGHRGRCSDTDHLLIRRNKRLGEHFCHFSILISVGFAHW